MIYGPSRETPQQVRYRGVLRFPYWLAGVLSYTRMAPSRKGDEISFTSAAPTRVSGLYTCTGLCDHFLASVKKVG